MNISFLLAGIFLLGVFDQCQAQPGGVSACPAQQWIEPVTDCEDCESLTNTSSCYAMNSTHSCCAPPGVAEGGMGQMGCDMKLRIETINEIFVGCLASPMALLSVSEVTDNVMDGFIPYVCPSARITLQCLAHRLMNVIDDSCSLEQLYDKAKMRMEDMYRTRQWWSTVNQELNTCFEGFEYQAQCSNPNNLLDFRTAIVSNCAKPIIESFNSDPDRTMTNLHCMVTAHCAELVKYGYRFIVNCEEDSVFDNVYESVINDATLYAEVNTLTGFNVADCTAQDRDCLWGAAYAFGEMTTCLATPMAVLSASDVISFNAEVACEAYLIAVGCIQAGYYKDSMRFMPPSTCGFAQVWHPLFINYLQSRANQETGLTLTAEVFNTPSCQDKVVNYIGRCPDFVQVKTAIIVFCSKSVYQAQGDMMKCSYLDLCIKSLNASYKAAAGECPTVEVFNDVTTSPEAIAEFSSYVNNWDLSVCDTLTTSTMRPPTISCRNVDQVFAEVLGGRAQECVMTFTALLMPGVSDEQFCETIWTGLRCAAYKIHNDGAACFDDMKREIQASPTEIYDIMARTLGEVTISGIRDKILNASNCRQAKIMRPVHPAIPMYLRQCAEMAPSMMNAVRSCVSSSFTNSTPTECMRFGRAARCMANRLITVGTTERQTKLFEHMVEQCIELMIDVMEDNIGQLASTLGSLRPTECMKISKVCGDSLWPSNRMCGSQGMTCPMNFTCHDQKYCCPMKRPGMCPKMNERRLCSRLFECDVDMDCHLGQKCCNQGCGYKTCSDIEFREKSACEMKFENFKDRILPQRACGDGTGSVHVPQCQNDKFGPIQGDFASGVLHCVTEYGMKIYGSEFRGNKDCPNTRPGRCPTMPSLCMTTPMSDIIGAGRSDMECTAGQKMCHVVDQNVCQMKCVQVSGTTEDTPFEVCPSGVERNCCPVDMLIGKVCVGRPSAVPRINPCGGCHVEFYDEHNQKVNCSEGISQCVHQRAMARMMNRDMTKNYSTNFLNFIKSRELFSQGMMGMMGMMDDMGMNLEDMRLDFGMDMMDNMEEQYEKMMEEMNEYGMISRRMEQMENDERMYEIGQALVRSSMYMQSMSTAMCNYFERHGICKNKGICVIGASDPEYLQICKCEDGYYGLFCEMIGTPSPDTACMRYKAVVDGIWSRVNNNDMHGELVHRLLTLFQLDYNIMPHITCTDNGLMYTRIQQGAVLPYRPNSPMIQYCVNQMTGKRDRHTLVALAGEKLDCNKYTNRDVLDLPKGCRLQPNGTCEDGGPCQYFYNSITEMCEPSSRMGHGHKTLSQCYMECGFEWKLGCPRLADEAIGICPVCPTEGCLMGQLCCPSACGNKRCKTPEWVGYIPKPCEQMNCNWASEFCLVNNTGHGMCKPFKPYCFQNRTEGIGNRKIGAYFFNPLVRRCDKFTYKGHGGNNNRFYSLHQCQMECGVYADYKFDFPVCPPPMMLTRMEGEGTMVETCEMDYDCMGNKVCCSDGMQGICVDPIRTCGTTRCSPLAKCENDTCICPTCEGEMMNEVCGDNGHRFDNLCMLKKYACEKMMNITVETCPTSPVTPPSMCPMACTLEYMPICAIEISSTGDSHTTHTFGNACAMRAAKMCDNRNLHPLYMGECEQSCGGTTCEPFQTCVNGQCTCPMCDTDLSPVCARPLSLLSVESAKMTFPSICEMRRYGCQVATDRMIIAAHEPCEKIDPEYECPATKMNIVRSAEKLCHTDTNAYCSTGHKCCPYGAGTKCIPMKHLKRKAMMRPGFCPILSYINYNRIDCYKKEVMCESDADVPPNMKCCDNMVCGHKTIAAAIGLGGDSVCGTGKRAIPGFRCNPDGNNHACPMDSTCTKVETREGVSMGVCCEMADSSDPMRDSVEVYGNKLCNTVERMGLDMICENGGRCVGHAHMGQMCQCPEGFVGTFCEKKLFDYTCPNSEITPCFDDPCNTAKCHIEGAYCEANYCGGCNTVWKVNVTEMVNGQMMVMVKNVTEECHAPRCNRTSKMYSTVFGLIHQREAESKVSRKKRDGHGGGMEEEEEMGGGDDMYSMLADPSPMVLQAIMKGMGFQYVPHDGEVKCMDGRFEKAQCFESLDEDGKDMCACVNPMTGMRVRNGPVAEMAEDLDCNFASNPGFPDICKEPPSNASCSGDETEMWYFCVTQGECIKYMDRGCNSGHKNSFPTRALCHARCGAMSVTPKGCETVRCGGGTVCAKVNGEIQCVDVTNVEVLHEYPEPNCEENGDYSPMQCQGNTCHCVTIDGEVLANTFGMAQTLKCYRDKDGNTLSQIPQQVQAKKCGNPNAVISICDVPGEDPCNNCEVRDNMGGGNMDSGNMGNNMGGNRRDPKVDMDGKCTTCETCPSGQGTQACTATCESAPVCKQFPGAMCKVDKCTCEVKYYKSGNQMVNCNAAQSQCEKAKMALEQQGATRDLQMRAMGAMGINSVDELRCSAKGAFYAICTTGMNAKCYCLNATDGMRMGQGFTNVNLNSLDCTDSQSRTIAKRIRASVKISDQNLEDISMIDRNTIVAYFRSLIQRKFPNVRIIVMRLISGSTLIQYEAEVDETIDAAGGTTDPASIADAIHTEIMDESLTVGENVFIVTEVTEIEFLTEEDLPSTTPIPTKGDETNTGLIIGLVVGGVALLLIIVVVIVICNRNKKSKSSSMQFSDLQGKDNPIYPYKA